MQPLFAFLLVAVFFGAHPATAQTIYTRQLPDGTQLHIEKSLETGKSEWAGGPGKVTYPVYKLFAGKSGGPGTLIWSKAFQKSPGISDTPEQPELTPYDAVSPSGWISLLYVDGLEARVDTFRLTKEGGVEMHTVDLEGLATFTLIKQFTFQSSPHWLKIIFNRETADPRTSEWVFSIGHDKPQWKLLPDATALARKHFDGQ